MTDKAFRSGFVTVIGRPNVGKSTLINRIVGEKVSIVSPRPQTTRNRVLGVRTDENAGWQLVFVDTPGIHKPRTRLGDYMEKSVQDAMKGMDLLVLMVDANTAGNRDHDILAGYGMKKLPRILAINKVDTVHPQALLPLIDSFKDDGLTAIIPISARTGEGVDTLLQEIVRHLPEGPRYFPDDMWTDQPERQICAELIREKALTNLRDEIPHGIGVEILSITQPRPALTEIHADLYVEREAHKRIVIGKQGGMLKRIGMQAREDMEALLGTQVNLQLFVKVRPDWRDNPRDLKTLGYTE
ncbi:MAG: GTPase Era [Clostridiales bacterium]|nr:GTPase Era [Clostridiales bacterium]